MNYKFRKGDRVKCLADIDGAKLTGKFGTVVVDSTGYASVRFDDAFGGHSCHGNCTHGHGWYVTCDKLELVKDEVIVIYRKDDSVIALNKATGEKTTARCHPDDKFDFEIGAKVAFDRLVGSKEPEPKTPKLYNGKVVCVEARWAHDLTRGKIYEFKDGVSRYDNGELFPRTREPYTSFEQLTRTHGATFIEVVE